MNNQGGDDEKDETSSTNDEKARVHAILSMTDVEASRSKPLSLSGSSQDIQDCEPTTKDPQVHMESTTDRLDDEQGGGTLVVVTQDCPSRDLMEEESPRPGAVRVDGPALFEDESQQDEEDDDDEDAHAPVLSAYLVDDQAEQQLARRVQELESQLEREANRQPSPSTCIHNFSRKWVVRSFLCILLLLTVIGVILGVTVGTRDKAPVPPPINTQSSPTETDIEISPTAAPTLPDPPLQPLQNQTSVDSWGLDRIDQLSLPLDSTYRYRYTGRGVTAFVLSGGILASHDEFSGKIVSCGANFIEEENCDDESGASVFGTQVAAILGGTNFGIAKKVNLVNVKAFTATAQTNTENILNAMVYIRRQKERNATTPMVALIDLGSPFNQAFNDAAEAMVNAGITVVVPAGNGNGQDACNDSPSSAETVITVASTTPQDASASFTSVGPCIDIFAPGENITSATSLGPLENSTISGDSMAAAHVAGVAALYLEAHPNWKPNQIWKAMQADAISNALKDVGTGSPNLLVNSALLNGL